MRDVVFLPRILCDREIWSRQASALSNIATSHISDLTLDDSIETIAARVIVGMPKRFTLVSLSMGDYVALEIMRRFLERVDALALFDTSASPDTAERQRRRKAGMESLAVGKFAGVTKRLLGDLIHPSHIAGPADQELQAMET